MVGGSEASRRDQASIKFRWIPLDVPSADISDIRPEGDISRVSGSNKQSSKHSEPKSPETLTTAQLVSGIGKVWDCANRPVPIFQPKPKVEHNESFCQNDDAPGYTALDKRKTFSTDFDDFHDYPTCAKHYSDMVNSSFEHIDKAQKASLLRFCSRYNARSFLRHIVQVDDSHVEPWKVNGLASLDTSFDIGKLYKRIKENFSPETKSPIHISQNEMHSKTTPKVLALGCTGSSTDVTKVEDSPAGNTLESVQSVEKPVTSLHSNNIHKPVPNMKITDAPPSIQSSEYQIGPQDVDHCPIGKCEDALENVNTLKTKEHVLEDVPTKAFYSGTRDKPKYALQNQKHALAGALSGTFVSLCLHPVDTIKTVTQSSSMAEKSIFHVVRSIISDRGVTGLYRGVASNIASSAPISAVYTYTYESVKAALIPFLPKEYHSIAHCMAGGCASAATSFIFTPSERIKQQMQVGSHYQNCWAALVGIVGRGGLSSLYTGWGAVLCRNIPHSIIKFYTYETLKQMVSSSTQSNARPTTYQTLICGGLAGCTAALFTTPFDVVKTRLQTQIPGSLSKYDGVFHALEEISKREGLKGLYRGLTPRLVMYVSQGALFFTSYELFKSIFNLELPQISIANKQNTEDDSISSRDHK